MGNQPINFDFSHLIDPNIHAVQWNGKTGHIEFKNGIPNQEIDNIDDFLSIVDMYNVVVEEQEKIKADKIANMTYKEKRGLLYPPIKDQLGAIWNALDVSSSPEAQAMKAQIEAIKAEYPKP
jgi:hypothetical protein